MVYAQQPREQYHEERKNLFVFFCLLSLLSTINFLPFYVVDFCMDSNALDTLEFGTSCQLACCWILLLCWAAAPAAASFFFFVRVACVVFVVFKTMLTICISEHKRKFERKKKLKTKKTKH